MDLATGIIKNRISMPSILLKYNFKMNRSGYICCPFHGEKTPSLKIYSGGKGWYCYGCGEGGSVIDFVMKLFHLDFQQTLSKISDDFNLNISQRPLTLRERSQLRQEQAQMDHERAEQERLEYLYQLTYKAVSGQFRRLWFASKNKAPKSPLETLDTEFIEALQRLDNLEWWLDENNTFDKWKGNT